MGEDGEGEGWRLGERGWREGDGRRGEAWGRMGSREGWRLGEKGGAAGDASSEGGAQAGIRSDQSLETLK